jgi:DNA-damage-inducible protein D
MSKSKSLNQIINFENKNIRRVFYNDTWYFSIIDIVAVLTEQYDPLVARKYWNKLAERLKNEGSEVVTSCHRLKLPALDGKMRETDCGDIEVLFRLIQSIPSHKAEPVKLWLAKVGYERVKEIADPEKSIDRARQNWQKMGRSDKWIQTRMTGQDTRNKLTDYWSENDVKEGQEYAILTNIIHSEWAGLSVAEHKKLKKLNDHNLRDHMSEAELIFTALAEMSTRQISQVEEAKGLEQNKIASKKGGSIAKNAKLELESKTGQKVITSQNYLKTNLKTLK